jgi:hypothetical protein
MDAPEPLQKYSFSNSDVIRGQSVNAIQKFDMET